MKFAITVTQLKSALTVASRVISSKSTMPVLDCVRITPEPSDDPAGPRTILVEGSDGDLSLQVQAEISEAKDFDRALCLPPQALLQTIATLAPGDILRFEADPQTLVVSASYPNGKFSLMGTDPTAFPTMPLPEENAPALTIANAELVQTIKLHAAHMANDDLRPVMCATAFDYSQPVMTSVSSDGTTMLRYRHASLLGGEAIYPAAAEGEAQPVKIVLLSKKVSKALGVWPTGNDAQTTLRFDAHRLTFETAGMRLTAKAIEGRYPNYNSVIPTDNKIHITLHRTDLLAAIKRVSVFASPVSALLKMTVLPADLGEVSGITLQGQDVDFATSSEERIVSVHSDYHGASPFTIGLKATLLQRCLESVQAPQITLAMSDPGHAVLFSETQEAGEADIVALLVPMLVS